MTKCKQWKVMGTLCESFELMIGLFGLECHFEPQGNADYRESHNESVSGAKCPTALNEQYFFAMYSAKIRESRNQSKITSYLGVYSLFS